MCLFVYSYCPWCRAMLEFGVVLCNNVTVRVSAGAAEEGGGGGGGLEEQGRVSGVQSCQKTVKNVACTAFQGVQELMWKCVSEREREREREREGVFVITLLQLVWDLSLTVAAW